MHTMYNTINIQSISNVFIDCNTHIANLLKEIIHRVSYPSFTAQQLIHVTVNLVRI